MLSYVYAWLWRRRCQQSFRNGFAALCQEYDAKKMFEAMILVTQLRQNAG